MRGTGAEWPVVVMMPRESVEERRGHVVQRNGITNQHWDEWCERAKLLVRLNNPSRVKRELYARFFESPRVQFPRATRHLRLW
jgi:hypothetical protein